MWPEIDIQTYIPPVGHEWLYSDSELPETWSGRMVTGWSQDPLYVTRPQQEYLVRNLLHLDAQIARTIGPSFVQVDIPTKAVWEGPSGLGNVRIASGYATDHFIVKGVVHLPTATLEAPLALPRPSFDLQSTVTHTGTVDWVVSVGASTHNHQLSYKGTVGVGIDFLRAEVRGVYGPQTLLEASLTTRLTSGAWTFQPGMASGLLAGPGNPKLRFLLSVAYGKKPIHEPETAPESEQPVEVAPEVQPPTPEVQPPTPEEVPPTAAAEPPTAPAEYQSISPPTHPGMGSLANTLRGHTEIIRVRLDVHTSCEGTTADQMRRSEEAAERVKTYLVQEGILEDRIEIVARGATQPIIACPELTDEERNQNRRVDAQIIEIRK